MTSLTQALPLTQGIDNQLCFLIIDYLTNINVWTKQVFVSSQYAYIKDDLASKQRPALFCVPMNSVKDSFGYSQSGRFVLEMHFSLQQQRVNLALNLIQIANLLQLINLNQDLTKYCQTYMPGLFWVGKFCQADYTKAYAKESVVRLELDYKVDLLAYQRELQDEGEDIISPDQQIYVAVQNLLEQVAILDNELNPVIVTV